VLYKIRATLSSDHRRRLARQLLEEMDREGVEPDSVRRRWAETAADHPIRAEYEAERRRFIAEAHPALARLAPPSFSPGQRYHEETCRRARRVLTEYRQVRRRLDDLRHRINEREDRRLVSVVVQLGARFNGWGGRLAISSVTDELSLRTCLSASDDELDRWIESVLAQIDDWPAPNRPPYLLFLNSLFNELGAERIETMKKGALEEEIRKRWPTGQFGPPSNNLITPMATILRSLRAKRGGAKRQQRSLS
jgi:hypothetical protein